MFLVEQTLKMKQLYNLIKDRNIQKYYLGLRRIVMLNEWALKSVGVIWKCLIDSILYNIQSYTCHRVVLPLHGIPEMCYITFFQPEIL